MKTDPHLQDSYFRHLQRFFALFPREQIRIILLEDLEAKPRATLAGLFAFLGVDPPPAARRGSSSCTTSWPTRS